MESLQEIIDRLKKKSKERLTKELGKRKYKKLKRRRLKSIRKSLKRKMYKRRRGTAVIESRSGVLLTKERDGYYTLPGGRAKRNESRKNALIRELNEETTLIPYSVTRLFSHKGAVKRVHQGGHFRDLHSVFWVKTTGIPTVNKREILGFHYWTPKSKVKLDIDTKRILNKIYGRK
jgi:8-oxo-dGTP pyrophosphatase MutT (NUDIX family)